MARRSRARYLAPIALAATIAGTYVIVHDALRAKTKAPHAHVVISPTRPHGKFAKTKYYAVQAGDSMSAIAAKTGVSLSTLESLNPHVDPNSLQTGQRLRLRR
jgi:LysM repeat protein